MFSAAGAVSPVPLQRDFLGGDLERLSVGWFSQGLFSQPPAALGTVGTQLRYVRCVYIKYTHCTAGVQ